MKLTRISICTLVLAVVLAALITLGYKELVAQIPYRFGHVQVVVHRVSLRSPGGFGAVWWAVPCALDFCARDGRKERAASSVSRPAARIKRLGVA
ncbi:hypothetical protein OKW49_006219 [Paraburkholderia youngii]|uniref:hypothetical protein n=1 Tax=Paraburkholderia youngii TaxID=2782701 RepID=UPI003D2098D2